MGIMERTCRRTKHESKIHKGHVIKNARNIPSPEFDIHKYDYKIGNLKKLYKIVSPKI